MSLTAEDGSRQREVSTSPLSMLDKDLPPIPEVGYADIKSPNSSHDMANGSSHGTPLTGTNTSPMLSKATSGGREAEDYINGGWPHNSLFPSRGNSTPGTSTTPGIEPADASAQTSSLPAPLLFDGGEGHGIVETPPATPGLPGRRSVQFSRSDVIVDAPAPAAGHERQSSWDSSNPSRSRAFMSRLKALAVQGGLPAPRGPGSDTAGPVSVASSPTAARTTSRLNDENGSDADADAEETADEAGEEDAANRPKKRKRRMHYRQRYGSQSAVNTSGLGGTATEPNSPLPSSSRLNMLRRATMPDAGDHRGGMSEGEGRDRLNRQHGWRRGSVWAGRNEDHDDVDSPAGRALGHVRRKTVWGGGMSGGGVSDGDALTPRRAFFTNKQATTFGVQKWRQMKNTWKMLRQKREDRFDYLKSAELMAELRAGAPAVLMLASMIQRDEHGNKRIPVLLEQVKMHISDSTPMQDGDSERHWLFTIDLEYGSGPSRMKWTIKRTIREILELHWKYKLAIRNDKYLHTAPVGSRPKQPRFPISAFPYVRGLRGVEMDDEDDGASVRGDDGPAMGESGNPPLPGDVTAGEGTATDVEGVRMGARRRKTRMGGVLGISRRSSAIVGADAAAAAGEGGTLADEAAFRRRYVDQQQRMLEKYLNEMVHWLIFRADSNRLCRFLELSALGVRLAAEGSYHGKECFLHIQSSKGLDFRRVLTPGKVIERHSRKWFLVRQNYIVCVESPENMNIYDVYLVDPKFLIISKTSKQRKQLSDSQKQKGKSPVDLELASGRSPLKHHTLTILTSERKVKLWGRNQHLIAQFEESIVDMLKQTSWHQRHRFDSFAPVRTGVFAQWLVDGRDYMWNVSRAISMAKDVIYIHDWWLSPELYMRRPAAISQKWRLDRLLQRKASEGVKIFVIVYRNVEAAVPIDSEYTKFSLLNLHPNIFVQRSPHQFKKNQFFFAHHEKICVVDHDVAFVGGIDLCFGRWDSPQHSLVDDKPTGFEMDDQPRDADHCQLWPGKDYSNPRVQDFFSLREPYKEMYDRTKVPRMPWHDVGMQIVGQPARDITRHFVQRWNYVRRGRKPTRPTPFLLPPPDYQQEDLESLGLSGTCEVQMLRSASAWSLGISDVECSIQTAYISMIEESEHFVYMENQFFITSTETMNVKIVNRIGDALVERIVRAHENDEEWRCVIIIPLMPGFQNSVADQEGTSVRLILQCQYRSICRGENSIFGRLRAAGIEPEDYIQFFSLRQWGRINNKTVLTTEQLYIHAKTIIVDDRVALIGSANINERSLLGDRDSEIAAIVRDRDMITSTMAGQPYRVGRFAHTLRLRLMQEHLGLDTDEIMEEDRQQEADFEADMNRMYGDAGDAGDAGNEDDEGGRRASFASDVSPRASAAAAAATRRTSVSGSLEDGQQRIRNRLQRPGSLNHDVDLQEFGADLEAPSLKLSKTRSVESEEAKASAVASKRTRDVEGYGEDRWTASKMKGLDGMRDSTVVEGREVLVDASFETVSGKPKEQTLKPLTGSRSRSGATPPATAVSTGGASTAAGGPDVLPPPIPSSPEKRSQEQQGFPYTSQLPSLPATDDTDIGGPPLATGQRVSPHAADIRLARITKDCMRDPVDPTFYDEVWSRVAENNTKIYRRVFRCMPDSEVSNWHDFQEFIAYGARFQESMENNRKKGEDGEAGRAPEGAGSSHHARHTAGGGAGISVPTPSVIGAVASGENVGSCGCEDESGRRPGTRDSHRTSEKHDTGGPSRTSSKTEMEKAAAAENAFKRREPSLSGSLHLTAPQTERTEMAEKSEAEKTDGKDRRTTFTALEKPPRPVERSSGTNSSVFANGNGNGNGNGNLAVPSANGGANATGSVKRRRRGTTKSSRRGFQGPTDELLSRADAEELVQMLQGQLVQFPYDWLLVEEGNGNWLYQVDQVAPLQIYN